MDDLEEIAENLTRRHVLVGAAGLGLGGAILSPTRVDGKLSKTEEELTSLAETVDQEDAADPIKIDLLTQHISAAMTSVGSILQSNKLDQAREDATYWHGVSTDVSIIPGVSEPSEPPIESRVRALQQAKNYYTQLQQVLTESRTVRETVNTGEGRVLLQIEGSPSPAPPDPVDSLATSIAQFEYPAPDQQTPKVARLLPDVESVDTALQRQREIYDTHIKMQQKYVETGTEISAGARQREQGQFESAAETFGRARENAQTTISERLTAYSMSEVSLTLGQYQRIFSKYQTGAATMARSCTVSEESKDRNALFNDGLEQLIQAREIAANGV